MEELKDLINTHDILMLTKKNCKYCEIAKEALKDIGTVKIVNIDDNDDLFEAAVALTNQRTVPNVWYNKKHIGGSNNVIAAIKLGEIGKKQLDLNIDIDF